MANAIARGKGDARLSIAGIAALLSYTAIWLLPRLLEVQPLQPLEALAAVLVIASSIASHPAPSRGWQRVILATALASYGLQWLLILAFGASLNPLAPSPALAASNLALLLPGYLVPAAAVGLLDQRSRLAKLIAVLATAVPLLPWSSSLSAAAFAAAVFAASAASGLASALYGPATGVAAAAALWFPLIASPIVAAAPTPVLSLAIVAASAVAAQAAAPPQPAPLRLTMHHISGRNSLAGLVILVAASVALLAAMNHGYYILVVATGSMEPVIRPGDIVVVAPAKKPVPGDIVAYVDPELHCIVVHRVISVNGDMFIAKGDANKAPDRPAPASTMLGRVALHIPYAGLPYLALTELAGGNTAAAPIALAMAAITLAALRLRRRS